MKAMIVNSAWKLSIFYNYCRKCTDETRYVLMLDYMHPWQPCCSVEVLKISRLFVKTSRATETQEPSIFYNLYSTYWQWQQGNDISC